MPLTFTGLVMVEEVFDKEDNQANSPSFNAVVVAETSSGMSVPFKVSIWVDMDNNMYAPIVDHLFQLDGKLSSGAEDMLQVEAIRFFPMYGVGTALPAFIIGTGLFVGRPEDGLFNLKSSSYANGATAELAVDCHHSAKQYQNVAKTIQKNQEIYFQGFLHDTDGAVSVVLKRCQFSYLGKTQKLLHSTSSLLEVVRTASDSAKTLMSPRKKAPSKRPDTGQVTHDSPAAKKNKRGVRKNVTDIIAEVEENSQT